MATNNSINSTFPVTILTVPEGGTGNDMTTHARSLLLGNSSNSLIFATGQSNGRPLIGSTGAAPVFAPVSDPTGMITTTLGQNSKNVDITNFVAQTSFSPTLTFGGGNTGMTGSFTGTYMVIAKLVLFEIEIQLTAKGSSTGQAVISTPPVSAGGSPAVNYNWDVQCSNLNFTNQVEAQFLSSINLVSVANGSVGVLTDTAFTNTTLIRLNGFYMTP